MWLRTRAKARLTALLGALVLISACSSTPASPPAPNPASIATAESPWRARIARAALREWEAWGRLTVDGWPEALPQEPDPANFERVLAYWSSVPEGSAVASRHRATHDALMLALLESTPPGSPPPAEPSISLWAYPAWSAAFVSYVMEQAGVPAFVFPPAGAHAFYIDALLGQAGWDPGRAAFLPHDPGEYAPRPGDLLCADRATLPILHWQERLMERGQFRPMHCDVVVANGGGKVQAIGGNVRDATVLRRFPADAEGRVLPPPPDKPPFILIFENRLDLVN